VRFTRQRFGHYDVIDFLVVLFGYAISGERTLETFYEGLQPFAVPFMALFGRDHFPARSTLSRFLKELQGAIRIVRFGPRAWVDFGARKEGGLSCLLLAQPVLWADAGGLLQERCG
jgi:hypothetical protein